MNNEKGALESATTPWGRWQVILDKPQYKVKEITVNPGQKLSYQKHFKREEHWVAVLGEGVVILEGQEFTLKPGDVIDIPTEKSHRAANRGDKPFIFIEIQLGSYFGEDDIVRLEDSYGRA